MCILMLELGKSAHRAQKVVSPLGSTALVLLSSSVLLGSTAFTYKSQNGKSILYCRVSGT